MKSVMNLFMPCVWFFALLAQAAAADSHQLRHSMSSWPSLEKTVRNTDGKPERKTRLMDAISKFRAEVCFKMKEEHNKAFASFKACEKYMEEACHPGKDKKMDGDRKEVTSGSGYCEEYFPQAEKKAKEQVDKEDKDEEEKKKKVAPVVAAPSPAAAGPGPAPPGMAASAPAAGAPAAVAPAAAGAAGGPAPGPAAGPAGSPGPAPVPAPFTPGLSAGKPYGTIEKDEAYYYKKGGKDAGRLHMSADMKLPTQGYWGKLVEHNDGETQTGDWGHEFGPETERSLREVCAKHPDNPWCAGQGYNTKSASPALAATSVSLVCAFLAMRAL